MKVISSIALCLLLAACSQKNSDKETPAADAPVVQTTPSSNSVPTVVSVKSQSAASQVAPTAAAETVQTSETPAATPAIPIIAKPVAPTSVEPTGPDRNEMMPANGCNQKSC